MLDYRNQSIDLQLTVDQLARFYVSATLVWYAGYGLIKLRRKDVMYEQLN